jgi:acylphosphatase
VKKTISITVSGKVHGVYYRRSTKEKASDFGITGFVKNLPDGSVYVIATGTAEQLAALKTWCKTGPPEAMVDTIATEELPLHPFTEFTIER